LTSKAGPEPRGSSAGRASIRRRQLHLLEPLLHESRRHVDIMVDLTAARAGDHLRGAPAIEILPRQPTLAQMAIANACEVEVIVWPGSKTAVKPQTSFTCGNENVMWSLES
jgi:hypothetical protein